MRDSSTDPASLLAIAARFPGRRIVLLGDLVADEFIYGEIARVSREAPVLILKQREKQIVPGGGANAANNLADLGARVMPVGVVGDDEAGLALLRYFEHKGVSTRRILRLRGYRTPTKSRVLGAVSHWQRQQIVRVDRDPPQPPGAEIRRRLAKRLLPVLRGASALVVSDYGYGSTDAREVEFLRRRARRLNRDLPLTVDSRFALRSYTRLTAATPNEPEVEEAFGKKVGNDLETLHRLGKMILRRQSLRALLVTRGRDGMALFERGWKPRNIPIFGSDQAVDVTGAGDTVVAAFSLALAAGASFLQAAHLANCAAGLVVMKRGTATVTAQELKEALRNS